MRRVADHEKEIGDFLLDGLLFMNGTDHQEPQPWLGRVVAEANELQDDYVLEVTTLPDYLAGAPTEGLQTLEGRAALGGPGQRPHGRGVEPGRREAGGGPGRAGPRAAGRAAVVPCSCRPSSGPQRLLELAWREMVRNAAHDSICACSVDEVVDAVLVRYAEAHRIADGLADQALAALARSLAEAGPTVVNASARPRSGVVEMVVAGRRDPRRHPGPARGARRLRHPPGLGALTLDATTVRTILGMLPNGSQIDTHTWIQGVRVEEDETGIDITIAFGSEERFDVPIASIKQDLYTRLGARPDAVVRIRIDQPPMRRVLARVADVPGFGCKPLEPVVPAHPVTDRGAGRARRGTGHRRTGS